MNQEFIIEEGYIGKRLTPMTGWSDTMKRCMHDKSIEEVHLNYARGWKATSLDFLDNISHIHGLSIIDWNIQDVSKIHVLKELRFLEISTYCKTKIDFSCFPNLEECRLVWRAGAKSLFNHSGLQRLFIQKYSGKDLTKFSQMLALEYLSIINSRLVSLKGIGALPKLFFLGLYNLRSLASLQYLEQACCITELEINGCRSIRSISEIEQLSSLRRLQLCDDGEIDTISPLERLSDLEEFLFYDSTNILDGDLSPLLRLKNLSSISFQNRRHYSHTLKGVQSSIRV